MSWPVADKASAAPRDRVIEEVPAKQAGVGEEEVVFPVAGHFCQQAKYKGEDPGGQQRLEYHPRYAKHRLLIAKLDIAARQGKEQITKLPDAR